MNTGCAGCAELGADHDHDPDGTPRDAALPAERVLDAAGLAMLDESIAQDRAGMPFVPVETLVRRSIRLDAAQWAALVAGGTVTIGNLIIEPPEYHND